MTRIFWTLFVLVGSLGLIGCAPNATSFSLLPEIQNFRQNPGIFNNQIDILFVIDNSDSMTEDQINLASNISAFISGFKNKGYDFKIAVTATDAYLANPSLKGFDPSQLELAKFRNRAVSSRDGIYSEIINDAECGDPAAPSSGYSIITSLTPMLESVFAINAKQCVRGVQDERAFSSMMTALTSPLNAGFLREHSFLAVIILSDEDDFSSYQRAPFEGHGHLYTNPVLDTVESYVAELDALTKSSPTQRRYNVSNISRYTKACKPPKWMQIPNRYMQLSTLTDGVTGDICDPSFAASLDMIQSKIAELSTQFLLYRIPRLDTIVVQNDGVILNQDSKNGWTYNEVANSIVFHGDAIPDQGSEIIISFIPAAPKT